LSEVDYLETLRLTNRSELKISKGFKPKYPDLGHSDRAIQKALLEAVALIKSESTRRDLIEALESRNIEGAIDVLRFDIGQDFLMSVLPLEYRDLFDLGGTTAAENLSRQLSLRVRFDMVNPSAVDFARSRSGELIREWGNSSQDALRGLMERAMSGDKDMNPQALAREIIDTGIGLTERQLTAVDRFRTRLENNPDLDLTQAQINARTERYYNRTLKRRGEMIARTETIRASREGQQEAWRQAAEEGLIDPGFIQTWSAETADNRCCPECEEVDGEEAPIGQAFSNGFEGPPAHPSCLPWDSLITSSDRIDAVSKRWYDGNLVIISTSAGYKLSCTPNHPILTASGWIPAHLLNIGSDVICHKIIDGKEFIGPNGQYVPTLIHQIAESFRGNGSMVSREVPVSAPDFHGDGMGSQVAVIRSDGKLFNEIDSPSAEQISEDDFVLGNIQSKSMDSQRVSNLGFFAPSASLDGHMCGRHLARSLVGGHLAPAQPLSGGLVARSEAAFSETKVDSSPTDSEFLTEPISGPAVGEEPANFGSIDGKVFFSSSVVGTQSIPFSGYVYNLETDSGWYAANGIVTHNCRCSLLLVA
jgi:hypothetical protein